MDEASGKSPRLYTSENAALSLSQILRIHESLKAGTDLNAKDAPSGKAPLFYVTESRISSTVQIQMIQALVGTGTDPNIRDALGRTPIFAAGKSKDGGEVIEALSKAGADLKIKDNEGMRPSRHWYNDYQRRL